MAAFFAVKETYVMDRHTCPAEQTTARPSRKPLGYAGVPVLLALLVGCSTSPKMHGSYGRDSFTFEADLPKDFGVTVQPHYYPLDPSKCQAMSIITGKNFTWRHGDSFVGDMKNSPYTYSVKIPLTYQREQCAMELTNVILEIDGRFGPAFWQSSYGRGGLEIVDELPTGAKSFENNELSIAGFCQWRFQQSHARSRIGEIEKLLLCSGAGAYLKKPELTNKKIKLAISVAPEDTPSYRDTWIKSPRGWRPCTAEGTSSWCRTPPTFQTFKMNGKTCTVYPNCTE